ncbi:MAG TPA: hypothetical protein VFV34_10450 [Blastocatellia bacterium]|nr:hypothetical protein [Blastocatellia bacterium]
MMYKVLLGSALLAAAFARVEPGGPNCVGNITFNRDIAPIIYKNCTPCHRKGEVAPFPLVSYGDVAKRAGQIASATASRFMPPWRPEPGYGEFQGCRRLSDREIGLINDWVRDGAVEGDAKDAPASPRFGEEWQMGQPDLILEMPEAFEVPPNVHDIFQCFVIPINLPGDKIVTGFEVRPGNRSVVHHMLMFLDTTGAARKRDAEDPAVGYSSFGDPGFLPTGALGAWAPGVSPFQLPAGVGILLKGGSDLVIQIHYHPDSKSESDRSRVGIYFSKTPVKSLAVTIPILQHNLDIPPGEKRHRVTTSFTVPIGVEVIGITPHMHLLGREMRIAAATPDNNQVPMIWIKDWDFHWQGQYLYTKPLFLPKGTVIGMEAFYDNSSDNPRNPNRPPERVGWGPDATDEMALCMILVALKRFSDLGLLRSAISSQPGLARNPQVR